jgi:PEP-CTERM motif
MTKKRKLIIWSAALTGLVLFWQPRSAHADQINLSFTPSFDTSTLTNQGPFDLAFVLTDGSGGSVGDQNTTVTLSNFNFGAGGSGSISTLTTISDTTFFNSIISQFIPGNQLSFSVQVASTSIDSLAPDFLEFLILQDTTGLPISTTDPSGNNFLIALNLDSASATPQVFSPVPEPGTLVLLASGLVLMLLLAHRQMSQRFS